MSVDDQTAIPAERMKIILATIEEKGSVQVKELAKEQKVSEATIRRDLVELEKLGSVKRTHGGAILIGRSTPYERVILDKTDQQSAEKRRIGMLASRYVSDGDTVFLSCGTTVLQLALNLGEKRNLTVMTNDLNIANAAVLHPSSRLILTGGERSQHANTMTGSIAENFLRQIRVDRVFLSADAADPEFGVSDADFSGAEIKSLVVHAGREVILLADKTKFGKTALARICALNEVGRIITDLGMPQAMIKKITEQGVALELV